MSFDLSAKDQASFVNIKGAELLSVEEDALVKCRNKELIQLQTPYICDNSIKNIVEYISSQK